MDDPALAEPTRELVEKKKLSEKLKLGFSGLGYEVVKNIEHGAVPEMKTIDQLFGRLLAGWV